MNKKVIIFGTTIFSTQLCVILHQEGIDIVGYTVDKNYISNEVFDNLPVYPFEELEHYVDTSDIEIVLTIGYNHMNDVRKGKYLECKKRGLNVFTFVSKDAKVYTEAIGEGSIIMPGSYIGPYSTLGICCVLWPGSVLSHQNNIGDYSWIAPSCCFGGGAETGKNCFLGLGATVRNEITLADYTFIGAHSYIGKNTLPSRAYLGVPAKQILDKDSLETVTKV